jgi:hypothetical protein
MKSTKVVLCLNYFAMFAFAVFLQAQVKHSESAEDSCRYFTQEFYDWYLPNTRVKEIKKRGGEPALDFAPKNRRSAFDPELVRQIEHVEAEEKREGEAILDFDPVLNSQDPALHYVTEKTVLKDGYCWADIYGKPPDKWRGSDKPDVVAELNSKDGQWLFMDFHYPNSEYPDSRSLLRMLRFLRKGDEKPPQ